jgi:CMP-N,N'-diacetyllegionaminic acid synthase
VKKEAVAMPKLVAIVPVRQGSVRLKDKNFKPFGGTNLLQIKLNQLKRVAGIDEIIVNTDSSQAIEIAKENGLKYFERDPYFASSECVNSDHWRNLAETTDADYIMHTLCTSPLLHDATYANALQAYREKILIGENDSVNTVRAVKKFMWLDNRPLNYDLGKAPNSQDLPNVVSITFGISIISRSLMVEQSTVIGQRPFFYHLDEVESVDIDTPLEFEFAEYLYMRLMPHEQHNSAQTGTAV